MTRRTLGSRLAVELAVVTAVLPATPPPGEVRATLSVARMH